ncbi:MAG: hypothetical protein WAJ93_22205 [Candidatus Nitrosopolaris sp.]
MSGCSGCDCRYQGTVRGGGGPIIGVYGGVGDSDVGVDSSGYCEFR